MGDFIVECYCKVDAKKVLVKAAKKELKEAKNNYKNHKTEGNKKFVIYQNIILDANDIEIE